MHGIGMKPYYQRDGITIHCGDSQAVTPTLPDNSVDLLIEDWPYYKVKGEWWDRQWDTPATFLEWIGELCQERQRILKPNGSLYVFASPKMCDGVKQVVGRYFNALNVIRWYKEAGWHKKAETEALRSHLEPWEAVIFAEHYGADTVAKGEAGYEEVCKNLTRRVFQVGPLCEGLGISRAEIGSLIAPDYKNMDSAKAQASNWILGKNIPNLTDFNRLKTILPINGKYEDLRREYEDLRRPFFAEHARYSGDLWHYDPVMPVPGKHPTEKPIDMIEDIIRISSRDGATVADFFLGRGTTARAAANLGRKFIGGDIMEKWCKASVDRLAQATFLPMIG